jgi:hypothetical protein
MPGLLPLPFVELVREVEAVRLTSLDMVSCLEGNPPPEMVIDLETITLPGPGGGCQPAKASLGLRTD